MKLDIDTILYILITVALLAISALRTRKKKQVPQAPQSQGTGEKVYEPMKKRSPLAELLRAAAGGDFDQLTGVSGSPAANGEGPSREDPLRRFESFLTGNTPGYESMEGESLESIMDEEEQIINEIRGSSQEIKPVQTAGLTESEPLQTTYLDEVEEYDLFRGATEIRKAVIYNEIFNRKYE